MDAYWRSFVQAFRRSTGTWYFPHATISPDNLRRQMSVFLEFDGEAWSDSAVNARLRAEHLTTGRRAGTRMLYKALENSGLCWVDDGVLRITPTGHELIAGADPVGIMERVLWRYQLSTPVNPQRTLRLYPHAALVDILLRVGEFVTRDEFILLVSLTTTEEVEDTITAIHAWRALSAAEKNEVIDACGRRFGRRATDAGYSMNFHATASYLERFSAADGRLGIRVSAGRAQTARDRLEAHHGAEWINYDQKADCVADMGASETPLDLVEAVDHYLDTSQIEKAVEAFSRLPANARGGRTVEEFERSAFLERDLEDHLVQNLDKIEAGLTLIGQGRQYPTTVGTMDIFARAANGDCVVVELKKVRASDKVFGQICRYMGWVGIHFEPQTTVRGYIVGSDVDEKLRMAASVVGEPTMKLKRFQRDDATGAIWIESDAPQP